MREHDDIVSARRTTREQRRYEFKEAPLEIDTQCTRKRSDDLSTGINVMGDRGRADRPVIAGFLTVPPANCTLLQTLSLEPKKFIGGKYGRAAARRDRTELQVKE
jgi:hypothetical protein